MEDHNNFQEYFSRGYKRYKPSNKMYKQSKELKEIIWSLTELLKEGEIFFDRQNFYKNKRLLKEGVKRGLELSRKDNLEINWKVKEIIWEVQGYKKEIYNIIAPFYRELVKRGFNERLLRG